MCTQIRDQYLNYPGISRAALAMVPTDLEIVRVSEGMLAILLAGGVAPQAAAWASTPSCCTWPPTASRR